MAGKQKYRKLLEPLQIRNVRLKNRIVKSAQWFIYPEPDGSVGERIKGWYETLAKGGAGLITVEESIPDYPLGASNVPHIRLDNDRFIPGLSELASVIHKYDCPAFVQITHAGPAHNPEVSGLQPVAPSSLDPPLRPTFSVARGLEVSEIKDLVEKFAQAALRVKKAGFDGVEIHMAHYALLNAFLSRAQNKRQDEYGRESLDNRARFSVEVLRQVRELVGPDFVVGVRMCAKEWGDELGTTNEEALQFAKMFEQAGADYLQLSAYGYGSFSGAALPDMVLYPEPAEEAKLFLKRMSTGALIPEAAAIKKAVSIPVSGVGWLDYKIGERILEESKVDMVCFGRHLMADPEFPNKLADGREKDIRPCLGCNYCYHMYMLNQPVQCRMNAFAGNETEMVLKPAERRKKVMVVGAGPAGMEAAKVAAERGHDVSLYDRAREIGGLLPWAAIIKGGRTDNLNDAIEYYRTQLKRLGVKVYLGEEVNVNLVNKVHPDVVILAIGRKPVVDEILVKSGARVVSTEQLKHRAKRLVELLGPRIISALTKVFLPIGEKVVVVGGDLAGLETAEFLAKRGRQVTIVDEAEQLGEGMLIPWLIRIIPWMEAKNIGTFTGVKYEEITSKGITITTKDSQRKTIEADTIIVITRYEKNTDLYQALEGILPELHLIGDAKSDQPGYIVGAIHDGARAGLAI